VYEARCRECGKVEDYYRPSSKYLDTPFCCGYQMEKVILTPPFGVVDIPAYVSPVTGKLIGSRSERREDLKRTGSREWEGMEQETKVAQERAKAEEKAQDAKLEESVVAAWNQLPSEKRAVLESAV
jgi:hypothetical protein